MLRTSRLNDNLSAYAQIWGQFDFNRNPLSIPGTKVLIFENAQQRGTYGAKGVDGWYIGPAMEHYRCYETYVSKTGGTRHADTVVFFPTKCNVPNISSNEVIQSSALDLIEALKKPHPATPLQVGDKRMRALETLAEIFHQTATAGVMTPPPRVEKYKKMKFLYHSKTYHLRGWKSIRIKPLCRSRTYHYRGCQL